MPDDRATWDDKADRRTARMESRLDDVERRLFRIEGGIVLLGFMIGTGVVIIASLRGIA